MVFRLFIASKSKKYNLYSSFAYLWSAFLTFVILSLFNHYHKALAQECDSNGICDKFERCALWKSEGECYRNSIYMKENCPITCQSTTEDEEFVLKKQAEDECYDVHSRCSIWASLGECQENKLDMSKYCAKSCNTCSEGISSESLCIDDHASCTFWASQGECVINPHFMTSQCRKSCGTCNIKPSENSDLHQHRIQEGYQQKILIEQEQERKREEEQLRRQLQEEGLDDNTKNILKWTESIGVRQTAEGNSRIETLEHIQSMRVYFNEDRVKSLPEAILNSCQNQHELCSFWALVGECENNKAYMTTNCAPACKTCHLIDFSQRCPKLENQRPALRSGGLNKMFERIVEMAPGNRTLTTKEERKLEKSKTPHYSVSILSRPSASPAIEVSAVLDKSLPPWVIVLDNFVTDEECDEIIRLGYKQNYKRSEDVGETNIDGTYTSVQSVDRTSENAWCTFYDSCRQSEIPDRLHTRIADVLQIPANNSEDFQILKYEKGQFYKTHHDYIDHQEDRQCGPRILTFFMYLSDVEKGGGTNFPNLDITVNPKKGRALLWPSVYDSDPFKRDPRFFHQALPVEEGLKYAVNGWIHMYDYVAAKENRCA